MHGTHKNAGHEGGEREGRGGARQGYGMGMGQVEAQGRAEASEEEADGLIKITGLDVRGRPRWARFWVMDIANRRQRRISLSTHMRIHR